MEEKTQMEDHILAVAKDLFLKHGFDKVSTTQIAKEAGCNQALVHYYYRTKTKLFERIMQEEIEEVFSNLAAIPKENTSLEEKLAAIVDGHFSFLEKNPNIPMFLFGEIRNNSEVFTIFQSSIKEKVSMILKDLQEEIDKEVEEDRIQKISSFDLILDIISLNIFTFIVKPFANLWDLTPEEQTQLLNSRKERIKQIIIASIRINRLQEPSKPKSQCTE